MKELLAFEWRYHTRQASFVAAAALFFLLGFTITATGFGPGNVRVTSPFLIAESLALLSLFAAFAVAIFASNAVLRDSEYTFEEIVFTTPIGRVQYVVSRFAGAYAAALTAIVMAIPGMMLATQLARLEPERVGSLSPMPYLAAFAIFAAPNVLVLTAVLFFVAVTTRSAVATYVAAAIAYVLYFLAAALSGSPMMAGSNPAGGASGIGALLDPFGLSSFFEQTRLWTIDEKNNRAISLTGALLANRAVWLALSLALGALLTKIFAFRVSSARNGGAARASHRRSGGAARGWPIELSLLLRSRAILLLLLAWTILAITEIVSTLSGAEYGSRLYATSTLATGALQIPMSVIGALLVVYFGAEVFWREQRVRFASILETTPVHGARVVLAKCAALAALVLAFVGAGVLAALGVQLANGWTHVEPLVYLSVFWFVGYPLVLYACASSLIHAVSPNKHVGMVLTLVFVVVSRIGSMVGLHNRLWRFASGPGVAHSEMNGFDANLVTFNWFMLHWTLVAVAMIAAAPRRPALLLIPIALSAAWIYVNTDVLNRNESEAEQNAWKAQYERAYRPLASLPQPRISEVDTQFDFAGDGVRIRGRYTLVNRTQAPLRSVLVAMRRDARDVAVRVERARVAKNDAAFGMHRFELDPPLAPGATTTLHYAASFGSRGFSDSSSPDLLDDNGSVLMNWRVLPTLGYRATYELRDPRERARRGLPAREEDFDDTHGESEAQATDWVKLTTTISTDPRQVAIGSGILEREWSERGRPHFRYRAEPLVLNRFVVAKGSYSTAWRNHRGVQIAIFVHHAHTMNVERMFTAAQTSLDLFEARFGGKYPHRQLSLVEAPSASPFAGYASPGVILLNESRSFLVDARDPSRIDLVARRTAHEVAHQWWGYQVDPLPRNGAPLIVESLTKHAELLVIEKQYGRDAATQLLASENDRYLQGRAAETDKEAPLANVRNQAYVFYAKGAVVLNGIRRTIGDAAMTAALRRVMDQHRGPAGAMTAAHLVAALVTAAPPADRPLIEEWLTKIIVYDFALESATYAPGALRLRINAAKAESSPEGAETPRAFRERVEIAVDGTTHVVELHEGVNDVVLAVKGQPQMVEVDPWVTRIDRDRRNNAKRVAP